MVNVTSRAASDLFSAPKLLPITLPVRFDEALGIQHPARWLGLYWEPELEQVCYTDGDVVGMGNAQAWRIFCAHSQIKPVLDSYRLGNHGDAAQHLLLLDRDRNQLYVGESTLIEDCLSHPASLNLLSGLDAPADQRWLYSLKQRSLKRLQPFKNYFAKGSRDKKLLFLIGVPAIAIGVYLLHEVGESIFDLLEFWDD